MQFSNAGVFAVKNNLAGRSIMEEWSRNGWEFSEKYWTKQDGKWKCTTNGPAPRDEQVVFPRSTYEFWTLQRMTREWIRSAGACFSVKTANDEQSVCRHQDVSVAVHFAGSDSKSAIPEFLATRIPLRTTTKCYPCI